VNARGAAAHRRPLPTRRNSDSCISGQGSLACDHEQPQANWCKPAFGVVCRVRYARVIWLPLSPTVTVPRTKTIVVIRRRSSRTSRGLLCAGPILRGGFHHEATSCVHNYHLTNVVFNAPCRFSRTWRGRACWSVSAKCSLVHISSSKFQSTNLNECGTCLLDIESYPMPPADPAGPGEAGRAGALCGALLQGRAAARLLRRCATP